MADSFAEFADRVRSNMMYVIVGFAFLCRLSIPGKPPTDDRTKKKVASLMRLSRQMGVHLFFLPPSAVNLLPEEMSPLKLLVDLNGLVKLGLDDQRIQETPYIRSRNLRLTPLEKVIEKISFDV